MANAVIMPKAGITVESCIIGKWEKKVGDAVKVGDILFSYETDKASFECESTAEGTLLEIFYNDGDEVPCLVNVCAVGAPGEDCAALRPAGSAPVSAPVPAAPSTPAPAPVAPVAPATPTKAKAVIMPKAGITVESCIIGKWEKKIGDSVKIGDILFSYETDKASFECESTAEGELLEIFYQDGDEVKCLENVCAIGPHGEDCSSLRPNGSAAEASAAASVETAASAVTAAPQITAVTGNAAVSPRARKLAERAGVDASQATPTGPNGRIIERDVRELMEHPKAKEEAVSAAATPAPQIAAPAAPAAEAPAAEYKDVKFSGIRRVISKSMHTSLSTMAQLTHNVSFDATAILNYRKLLKAAGGEYAGITIGDIILYAVSRTLPNHPDLNAHMLDDTTIRLFDHVNLGVAVDTPRGLMVPTIFKAEELSLLEISKAVKEMAGEARSGAINPDKLAGGTFTVSNLGSYGVESFTPVINPPQTGILGVCTSVQRPRIGAGGAIELYPAMGLSLTYDHRAVDGGPASRFLQELCKNLEQFTMLLAK